MKATLLAVMAAVTLAAAQPHNQKHQHLHVKRSGHQHHHQHAHAHAVKRVAEPQQQGGYEEMVWVCQLGDVILSEAECQQGIANGTLISPDGPLTQEAPPPPPTTSSTSTPPPPPSTTSSPPPPPTTSSTQNNVVAAAAPTQASTASGYIGGSGGSSGGSGVDSDFPDGQISCSDFPDEYGAQSVPWLGLGGWTGVQCPGDDAGGFANIFTVKAQEGGCAEGCYCSYACPAGYQKIQWPTLQGLTGQSVGGLQCKGGKLHLSNSDFSTLCQQGDQQVQVTVQNTLSQNAAVCRTDYPGEPTTTFHRTSLSVTSANVCSQVPSPRPSRSTPSLAAPTH